MTPEILTVKQIAAERGCSVGTIVKPWNLPFFGKSDFEEGSRRWYRHHVAQWYARPLAERRAEWEEANPHRRIVKRNKVRT